VQAKKLAGKRTLLSECNTALALEKVEKLKQSHCKINMTEFINLALDLFFAKHFDQHEKQFEKQFFDRKRFLKELLKSDSKEELDESLKSLVKKIKPTTKRKVKDEASHS